MKRLVVSREFRLQMEGYDLAPEFPMLKGFLSYWERELEGALHSVRVAHHRLIQPAKWQVVDGVFTIQ